LARIIEVQQKLGAGEDFAAVALAYSDDPGSKLQGGDLGWFARDQGLVKEFEDAAFSLEPGKLSDPVKTQFGYHLIKVDEKDPARPLDAYMLQTKQYEAYNTWLTDLRNAARWTGPGPSRRFRPPRHRASVLLVSTRTSQIQRPRGCSPCGLSRAGTRGGGRASARRARFTPSAGAPLAHWAARDVRLCNN